MSTPRERLVASDLPGLLRTVLSALAVARQEIDDLNVFPVPDGDTGTNLVATVHAAVEALDTLDAHADDTDVAMAAARGALRGAAGNSGVIFSQVVRAWADQVAEGPVGVAQLPGVCARARDLATEAVAEPAPGTILTAVDAAAAAAAHLPDDVDLAGAIALLLEDVGEAVAASRDVLEANRAAGVVDAGARGFEVALDGMLAYVEGRRFEAVPPPPVRRTHGQVVARESGSSEYAHEVQYLLEAPDDAAAAIRGALEEIGDSVVVVACGGLLNVHVHTNAVDAAVAVGAAHGEPSRVQVTSFADQRAARAAVSRAEEEPLPTRTAVGYLAVVPGQGVAELARSMGAVTVDGTAGQLPTVATVLNAVGSVRAEEVVLLPGHPNVVPTMRQASDVSVAEGGRPLHVVEAAVSVPAVLAVLAVAPTDALALEDLAATARGVAAGEVVAAVRDATTPLGTVREGQWLAVVDGEVLAATDGPTDAIVAVLDAMVEDHSEIVTLVVGAGVGPDERQHVVGDLQARHPGLEVDVVDGGQRPARWIVGVE